MRILVVCGSMRDIRMAFDLCDSTVMRIYQPTTLQKEGGMVHFAVLNTAHDLERFRGLRYDVIIEHESFNLRRSLLVGRLLYELRKMVLR